MKKYRKHFILLLLALGITNAQLWSKPVVVPFSLENNCIYIYCKVNETDSLKFLFDTGANGSVINARSKHKLRLNINGNTQNVGANGANEVEIAKDNTISFGTITKDKVALTVIPYETVAFDGVFGTNLMKGRIVAIDYDAQRLVFYEKQDKIDYAGFDKQRLYMVDDYPAVKCSLLVKDKVYSGLFGLDSGADDALTVAAPFAAKNRLSAFMERTGTSTSQGSDGSAYEQPVVRCPEIKFSNKHLYNFHITLSRSKEGIDATDKMAGFFGNNLLKRFNTIIDFEQEVIYFKLNENLYSG
ncbi:MAG: hypothetical protein EOP54_11945 [Sphingobacteriales bacterium]|nr:MAG: hypothetical protein EOP54_11945 [Sphingobacteriales bacterium]